MHFTAVSLCLLRALFSALFRSGPAEKKIENKEPDMSAKIFRNSMTVGILVFLLSAALYTAAAAILSVRFLSRRDVAAE